MSCLDDKIASSHLTYWCELLLVQPSHICVASFVNKSTAFNHQESILKQVYTVYEAFYGKLYLIHFQQQSAAFQLEIIERLFIFSTCIHHVYPTLAV